MAEDGAGAVRTSRIRVALVPRPLLHRIDGPDAHHCLVRHHDEPRVSIHGKSFAYDHVHAPDSCSEQLFVDCVRDCILPRFKAGFNATIIAYGQTGSGKTHTMGSGNISNDQPGLIQHTVSHLFASLPSSTRCWISFIQVYCEEIQDLLELDTATGGPMTLQHSAHRARPLPVPRKERVHSPAEVNMVLMRGAASRATGATFMNADSSRSHAIITLELAIACNGSAEEFRPKLHFVDLAGSERCKRAGTSGKRLKEGNAINKGLHALGNVVNALEKGMPHVPYRDAAITRLLEDSLGGNSQTLVVACVSPTEADVDETINTLQYAGRMRQILNKPVRAVNTAADAPLLARLKQLQAERKRHCTAPKRRLRTEEIAVRDRLRMPAIASPAHDEMQDVAERAQLHEALRASQREAEAMSARVEELHAAVLRAPCKIVAAAAVNRVVVRRMQEELDLRNIELQEHQAQIDALVVERRHLQRKMLEQSSEIDHVKRELEAVQGELLVYREMAVDAPSSTSTAIEPIVPDLAQDTIMQQSKDREAMSVTSEVAPKKRAPVEMLEEALESSRLHRRAKRKGDVDEALAPLLANAEVEAQTRFAVEQFMAEEFEDEPGHDGSARAIRCARSRRPPPLADEQRKRVDADEAQKEVTPAWAAFKSQSVRDGYGSIYGVDLSMPKRSARASKRAPLHDVVNGHETIASLAGVR